MKRLGFYLDINTVRGVQTRPTPARPTNIFFNHNFLASSSWLALYLLDFDPVFCQVLRLHLDSSDSSQLTKPESGSSTMTRNGGMTLHFGILAGAVVLTSIGVLVYLKRSKIWGSADFMEANILGSWGLLRALFQHLIIVEKII